MATVVIVGAGVTGLLTALECTLAGHRVTVLDRGPIPNPESSSFDQHRAIRTYSPNVADATRRKAALRRWLELEALLGTKFFRRTGIVTAMPRDQVHAPAIEPEQLPHMGFPAGSTGVLDFDGGVLLAQRVLRAATHWLRGRATLRPWTDVTDVGDGHVVLDGGETVRGDLILVAAGPWVGELADLPVTLHRQTVVYLKPPDNLARWWENAPGAGGLGTDGRAWLLPPVDGTLLKISSDAVCRRVRTVDSADPKSWVDQLLNEAIVSDVDRYAVVMVKQCHYLTDARTGGALLTHPSPSVWVRAACGGSGFSEAPLVAGQIRDAITKEAAA